MPWPLNAAALIWSATVALVAQPLNGIGNRMRPDPILARQFRARQRRQNRNAVRIAAGEIVQHAFHLRCQAAPLQERNVGEADWRRVARRLRGIEKCLAGKLDRAVALIGGRQSQQQFGRARLIVERAAQIGNRVVGLPRSRWMLRAIARPLVLRASARRISVTSGSASGKLVLAEIDLGQGILRSQGLVGRACAGDQLLQQLDAVIGLALREVKLRQRNLVGECALAGLDARDQLLARRRGPFERGQQIDQLELGIRVGGIGGGDRAQLVDRVVLALVAADRTAPAGCGTAARSDAARSVCAARIRPALDRPSRLKILIFRKTTPRSSARSFDMGASAFSAPSASPCDSLMPAMMA